MLPLLLTATACTRDGNGRATGSVGDIDGNRYGTVVIGGKGWMTENLRVGRYRNGDPIPEVQDSSAWSTLVSGAWSNYGHREENGKRFGKLYNWHAVNDPRGLAPVGWHVATDREWTELAESLGGEARAGEALKAPGKWSDPAAGAGKASGFDALPAGARRDNDGAFVLLGQFARFWTSTPADAARAYGRAMEYYDSAVRRGEVKKENGFSVRCVKD
ncbi:MAG: hypothetical protein HGB02_02825 [Chlorobiaceae bacterium]|nr:hypothetical protein [Chlorobiaceae bacterium]